MTNRYAVNTQKEANAKKEALFGFSRVARPTTARSEVVPAGQMSVQNVCMPMNDFLAYEKTMHWRGIRNMVLTGVGGIVLGIAGYIYFAKAKESGGLFGGLRSRYY